MLVSSDMMPASRAVETTTFQSTAVNMVAAPMAAMLACATVLSARTPAALPQLVQYSML